MTPAAVGADLRQALERAVRTLAAAGIETARADAEWLLADLAGVGRLELRLALGRELSEPLGRRFDDAVARRAAREPLQQILGWESFCGLRLRVTPSVLVPRPETETLVEWALGWLPAPTPGRTVRVVDVGTGSGCIACAVAAARPDARILALDVSPAALVVARENVAALGLGTAVRLVASDLLAAVGGRVDLVIANLPYLSDDLLPALQPEVSVHEPRTALAGGADGLDVLRRLIEEAPRMLGSGGTADRRSAGALVLETAGGVQADAVASLMAAAGFVGVTTREDLTGVVRFVAGRAAEETDARPA